LKDNTGIHVVYGIFSYAQIPKKFDVVMGVSGTLSDLIPEEKKILSVYNIDKVNISASMYGAESRLKFEKEGDVAVYETPDEWMLKITQSAKDKINAGRSVIVVFRTPQDLQDYQSAYSSKFEEKYWQVLEESSPYKTNIIQKASKSKMMTLITRSFGRGSDFACQDNTTLGNGGVHVIQTFPSESAAEETQIKGRTARQGDPGSYEMILLQEDVLNAGTTAEQIATARSEKSLHHLLCHLRDSSHSSMVQGLIKSEKSASQAHDRTMKLHQLLLNYSPDNDKEIQQLITEFNGCTNLRMKPYHFFFVLDDSGSMGPHWKSLMRALAAFIDRRMTMCANTGSEVNDLATIINYSDTVELMCANEPLTKDVAKRTKFRGGWTDFKVGLDLAHAQMSQNPSSYKPVLVFMSDGGSSTGDAEMEMIKNDFSPYVYVLGFGKSCDRNKLKTMAQLGHGEYYEGANGAKLKEVFEEVSTRVSTVNF